MNALVTGARGFTARHLLKRLRAESRISVIGSDLAPLPHHQDHWNSYLPCDLGVLPEVVQLIKSAQPQWVFHLAGIARGRSSDIYRANLLGTVNLLEVIAAECPDTAVLLVGSAAEYGVWPSSEMPLAEDHACRPVGPYGLSKYAMTQAAQYFAASMGLKVVIARPFNIVGAGMPANLLAGAIVQRAKAALAGGKSQIPVGNLDTNRDFVAVEDVVGAYLSLIQSKCWGQIFNVCSGQPCSVREIIDTLLAFAPARLQPVIDQSLMRPDDPPVVVGDPSRLRRLCGFIPSRDIHDALRAAWDFCDCDTAVTSKPLPIS